MGSALTKCSLDRWRSQRRLTELTDDEMAERCLETGSSSEMVEALKPMESSRSAVRSSSVLSQRTTLQIFPNAEMTEGAVAGAISRCRSYLVKLLRGEA